MPSNLSTGHIFGHPFFLVTFIVAVLAWIIAFASQIAAEAKYHNGYTSVTTPTTTIPGIGSDAVTLARRASVAVGGGNAPVVKYLWYSIWIQLAVTVHLFLALCTDQLAVHRFQIAIFLAIAEVFAVYGTEFIFSGAGALIAVGVGWLLIAMVDLLWILYLTSEEDTLIYNILNSGGNGGLSSFSRGRRNNKAAVAGYGSEAGLGGGMGGGIASSGYGATPQANGRAFPASGTPGTGYAPNAADPATQKLAPAGNEYPQDMSTGMMAGQHDDSSNVHRAKAMYAYNASQDDPNEVSFAKGDILEVIDSTGKWYQVRTPSGQTGIAPSNYLTML